MLHENSVLQVSSTRAIWSVLPRPFGFQPGALALHLYQKPVDLRLCGLVRRLAFVQREVGNRAAQPPFTSGPNTDQPVRAVSRSIASVPSLELP